MKRGSTCSVPRLERAMSQKSMYVHHVPKLPEKEPQLLTHSCRHCLHHLPLRIHSFILSSPSPLPPNSSFIGLIWHKFIYRLFSFVSFPPLVNTVLSISHCACDFWSFVMQMVSYRVLAASKKAKSDNLSSAAHTQCRFSEVARTLQTTVHTCTCTSPGSHP